MSSLLDVNQLSDMQDVSLGKKVFFSQDEIKLLNLDQIPKHVAIIPDGNRRWAKKKELGSNDGHYEGADILMDIIKAGIELGIETMTFYTFSTENWKRDEAEVQGLMWLLQSYLSDKQNEMTELGCKFQTIGDLSKLSPELFDTIKEVKKTTFFCDKINVVLAINYGSRDELCRAIKSIACDYSDEKIKKENITEDLISSYLDTHSFGDPELLIRTGGEWRISNFLLWQLSYSEIYVSTVFWPDYRPHHLFEAIHQYQQRQRRLGGP